MVKRTCCDQCYAVIPDRATYYSAEKITPEWEDHEDTDFCSLACLVAWATAQGLLPECQFDPQDLDPEPVDRATGVPADVWAETIKAMD
jgi:hypothetical protein